jgi:uncharacterized protein (DUF1778 family)
MVRTYVPRRRTPPRNQRKSFWGTTEEVKQITRAAEIAGLKPAEFIRDMVLVAAHAVLESERE